MVLAILTALATVMEVETAIIGFDYMHLEGSSISYLFFKSIPFHFRLRSYFI